MFAVKIEAPECCSLIGLAWRVCLFDVPPAFEISASWAKSESASYAQLTFNSFSTTYCQHAVSTPDPGVIEGHDSTRRT